MTGLNVAPALSTPDTHVFQDTSVDINTQAIPRLDDDQFNITYEIERTVAEIRAGRWKRIALQFPDHMLLDAPRVFTALSRGLKQARKTARISRQDEPPSRSKDIDVDKIANAVAGTQISDEYKEDQEEKLFILADTSYGACCVDEIAAEHADAEVVVHYGRSCLSPTARLPVIYVFTKPPLDISAVVQAFQETYKSHAENIILAADIPYASYVAEIGAELCNKGYTNVFCTEIIHNTGSPIPNRTVPAQVLEDIDKLREYYLFHISDPPDSLLLTLASRVNSINIYPTNSATTLTTSAMPVSSAATLRRRYALLTSITTVPIFGILINTLSVKNYMHILTHIKKIIVAAGKKSYTFVVGKVNAAKVANFAEVGGWVVVGCWESSLFDSKEFWKPIITPFELELALQGDTERVWTGQWRSDFETVLKSAEERERVGTNGDIAHAATNGVNGESEDPTTDGTGSEDESEPPEYDLRTGRYVSHSRPMNPSAGKKQPPIATSSQPPESSTTSQSLIKRANGDLAVIGNAVSPAAEFFREKRSWQGLGSDYEIKYDKATGGLNREGAVVEQGRVGIARGYVVGEDVVKH